MRNSYQETIRSIQSGKVDPVYFLNGEDFFLQNMIIEEVEKVLSKISQLEKIFFTAETMDFDRVLTELNSVSLFPLPRVFILQNPIRIQGQNKDELLSYCKSPNSDNCLIITIDKYDPNNKLVKSLTNLASSVTTLPPFPEKMPNWAKFLFEKHGLSVSETALEKLLEFSGDSVYHLANEIEKIKLGLGVRTNVDEEDILAYAGWKRDFSRWDFLIAIGEKDFKKAVLIGKNLLDQGMDISLLISLVTTLFQVLLFKYIEKGEETDKVQGQYFWLSRKVSQRLPVFKKLYSRQQVMRAFRFLSSADRQIKSSSITAESILIPLVYRFSRNSA